MKSRSRKHEAELCVRRARLEDRAAVTALWREVDNLHAKLVPTYFRTTPGSPRPAGYFEESLDSSNDVIFVAELADEVVGFIHLQLFDTPAVAIMVQARRVHVDDLVVIESHRRQGIGRALMATATTWAREQDASELVLTVWHGNRSAERFYEELGYREISSVMMKSLK